MKRNTEAQRNTKHEANAKTNKRKANNHQRKTKTSIRNVKESIDEAEKSKGKHGKVK